MKLGISSYTYLWEIGVPGHPPERPLQPIDLLQKASALGVRLVQIADNLPPHQPLPAGLDALAEQARDLSINIEVDTRGISQSPLRSYPHLAKQLEASLLRVVVDTAASEPISVEIVQTMAPSCVELEQAGVILAVENHDRLNARTLDNMVEQISSDYGGVCLDTVNSFGAIEGPESCPKATWSDGDQPAHQGLRGIPSQPNGIHNLEPAGRSRTAGHTAATGDNTQFWARP